MILIIASLRLPVYETKSLKRDEKLREPFARNRCHTWSAFAERLANDPETQQVRHHP